MEALIVTLPGDGIGPEVLAAGQQSLEHIAAKFGHSFKFEEKLIGGAAIDATGSPLPDDTIDSFTDCDAVLLGAVGGPKWSDPNAAVRPEQGLLNMRNILGVYANIRPVKVLPALADASPLKAEVLSGVDMLVIRELTGGIYFGEKTRSADSASDLCVYSRNEVERIVRFAAGLAKARRGRLCSVDKANVLETSRLWRDVTDKLISQDFPDLALETSSMQAVGGSF